MMMRKKKTNTIKWKCPNCDKEWISTIKYISFAKCYNCEFIFILELNKKKWKYVDDKLYE